MEKSIIPRVFLLLILASILYLCYAVFRPLLPEIIVAGVLASIFYPLFIWLSAFLGGRRKTSALIICLAVMIFALAPIANFIVYAAQKLIEAYADLSAFLSQDKLDALIHSRYLARFSFSDAALRSYLLDALKEVNNWIFAAATGLIKGTTSFIFSLVLIILSLFFFLIDGEAMLKRVMRWTPLPNKYDERIFRKFKDVSLSAMVSTFVISITQGALGALGFFIVGLPAFLGGVLMVILSPLPYIGSAAVWFPAAIYLLLTGSIWQGIFLLIWGFGVISVIDNIIRAYIIKGKAQVHPLFIIFSIIGGVAVFGFWGVVFGPLIISVAVTILHIYELEYGDILEK
ncbi:MAG: AI-2E family transporter [Patescibacteria group bacterium]|jgi:predicted PurR-regulated permease PerM